MPLLRTGKTSPSQALLFHLRSRTLHPNSLKSEEGSRRQAEWPWTCCTAARGLMTACVHLSMCLHVHHLSMCPCVCVSVCPSVYVSICLSARHLFICPRVCVSVCLSARLSMYLSVHVSVNLPIYPHIHVSVCLSVHVSVCPNIHSHAMTSPQSSVPIPTCCPCSQPCSCSFMFSSCCPNQTGQVRCASKHCNHILNGNETCELNVNYGRMGGQSPLVKV